MKKLIGVVVIAACMSIVGVGEAKAGGPFMITFPDFCDVICIWTHSEIGRTWITGLWDWTCSGTLDTTVSGLTDGFSFGTHPTVPFDAGFSATFKMSSGLFDFGGTFDGPTFTPLQDDKPYVIVAGCNPPPPDPIKPDRPPAVPIAR